MPRSARKILVADTPEELEQQLRAIAQAPRPIQGDPEKEPDEEEEPAEPDEEDDDYDDPDSEDGDESDPPAEPPGPDLDPDRGDPREPAATLSHYEARIHIVDAWKYQGSIHDHPAFVDPGWVSWADYDEVTKRPAGPALRVPTDGAHAEKLARKGDYIVRQAVTVSQRLPPDVQLDVWTEQEFERIFIPVKAPSHAAAA